MEGKKLYEQSGFVITILIAAFVAFTMFLLVFGLVDNIFFGSELSVYLSNNYFRYMYGFIMIPIFGIAAVIMYFSLRSNKGYEQAMYEKFDAQEDLQETPWQHAMDPFAQQVEQLAEKDSNFAELYRRFNGYVASISGSENTLRRQALDIGSGGRPNMFFTIFVLAFVNLPFLLSWAITAQYVESKYGISFYDAMKQVRQNNSTVFYGVLLLSILTGAVFAIRYVYSLINNVVKVAYGIGSQVLNTEPAGPLQDTYTIFISQKIQFQVVSWRRYLYIAAIPTALLPLAIGVMIADIPLGAVGGSVMLTAILLLYFDDGKGEAFQISDKGWIRIMNGKKITDFSLSDCEEVVVRYASIHSKNIRISSTSAAMRDIAGNMMKELMNAPELVPTAIIFYRKSAEPIALPLRYLADELQESFDPHQAEFMFAYWLKQFGFSFELAPSNEDAGDWRAVK